MGLDYDHAPECWLATIVSYERTLFISRGADGRLRGGYVRREDFRTDSRHLVSPEIQSALLGCQNVPVFSSSSVRGDPHLLSPEIAWNYRGPRQSPPSPVAGTDFFVIEAAPQNSSSQDHTSQDLPFGWLITGPSETKNAVTTYHARTWKMEGDFFKTTSSCINGNYPLVGAEIAQRSLSGAPIVLWKRGVAAPQLSPSRDPFSNVPSAYIEAGARGVFSDRSKHHRPIAREVFDARAQPRSRRRNTGCSIAQ